MIAKDSPSAIRDRLTVTGPSPCSYQATKSMVPRKHQELRGSVASDRLDMIRGLAAVAVLYSHARVLLMESASGRPSLISRFFYILSGYGHSSVVIFFVLSGYLVGGSAIRSVRSRRWSWREYLLARGVRLYIVLLPALLLTVFWDQITIAKAGTAPYSGDTGRAIVTVSAIASGSTPAIFFGNLLFLETILVPSYGSNLVLWSLANEAWYYLIFPLCLLAFSSGLTVARRICYLSASISLMAMIGINIIILFPIWLFGAGLAIAPPLPSLNSKWIRLACSLPLVAVLLLIGLKRIPEGLVANYLVGTTFTLYLLAVLQQLDRSRAGIPSRAGSGLSKFSYTLYLVHLPLLICMRAFWTQQTPWPADLLHWMLVLFACLACMAYAYGISLLTEARTPLVRERIGRLLA